jgi:hypothetical protein
MLPLIILGAAAATTLTIKAIKKARDNKNKSFPLELTESIAESTLATGALSGIAAVVVCALKGFTINYFVATWTHYLLTALMFVSLVQVFVWSLCVLALIATAYIFNAPINPPLER